jgi:hypothetical protein
LRTEMAFLSSSCVTLTSLIVVSLLCGSARAQLHSCYNCSSDTTGRESTSCRIVNANTPVTLQSCAACSTSVSSGEGGALVYSRNCHSVPVGPLSCVAQNSGGICVCNTTLCNKNAFLTIGTLSCYSCASSGPLDNGCGRNLITPGSGAYTEAIVVSGCISCTKTVGRSPNSDTPFYTRGCGHEYDTGDSCASGSRPGCSFSCTTSLCNRSTRSLSLSSITSFLLAVVFAASFCRK